MDIHIGQVLVLGDGGLQIHANDVLHSRPEFGLLHFRNQLGMIGVIGFVVLDKELPMLECMDKGLVLPE